jgi:type III pantothenate kinase
MLLTIDLGNTNTVLGVFEGETLLVHWRLTTRREQTADEYGVLVRNLFSTSGLEPGRVAAEIPSIGAVDPVLTLTGLRLVWERNRPAAR